MKITQISVFLENKKGRLFEVASKKKKNNINIRALNIAETDDFGVLRIVVDKPAQALASLRAGGFVANTTDIVAVEVSDKPGGLSEVLRVLSSEGLNIEYMYGFMEKMSDKAILVFRFEEPDTALGLLKKNGQRIITETDMKEM